MVYNKLHNYNVLLLLQRQRIRVRIVEIQVQDLKDKRPLPAEVLISINDLDRKCDGARHGSFDYKWRTELRARCELGARWRSQLGRWRPQPQPTALWHEHRGGSPRCRIITVKGLVDLTIHKQKKEETSFQKVTSEERKFKRWRHNDRQIRTAKEGKPQASPSLKAPYSFGGITAFHAQG